MYTVVHLDASQEILKFSTLDYNALVMTPQTSVTITHGIQPTGVVTMATKVLHNTYNMCICNLLDTYPSGFSIHIRQIPNGHIITSYYMYSFLYVLIKF